ncbi:SMI1/KNR4 family protein [Umezawaea endophytica]|uniref:SMI1/KNR4 family protein n=1 Tax=Umezawaea endophytica TaxID=1654476 RepID=A0A9X2VT10_9PSEU|nr:SMI1/KNR4 family protein [Umezawaea endophytica]MCS7481687.1 SMI1/KNR4 family protein [Umezawaea endophytica]
MPMESHLLRVLDDRAAAWMFIRDFAAEWVAPLTADDGCDDAELDAAEARLGVRLPAALREAYRLFGRREDLTRNQDRLLPPDGLVVEKGLLVFREENQWVAHWGVPVEDLDRDDPRVVMTMDLADPNADPRVAWFDRFSVACVEMVLSESLFVPEDLATSYELTPDDVEVLERWATPLPLPEYPAGGGSRWFTGPDLLLREDGKSWLWVRARTEEALDEFVDAPEEWLRR